MALSIKDIFSTGDKSISSLQLDGREIELLQILESGVYKTIFMKGGQIYIFYTDNGAEKVKTYSKDFFNGVIGLCETYGKYNLKPEFNPPLSDKNQIVQVIDTSRSISAIAARSFYYCKNLEYISLPATKTIAAYSFNECSKLKYVNVSSINEATTTMFKGATSLSGIYVNSEQLMSIPNGMPGSESIDDQIIVDKKAYQLSNILQIKFLNPRCEKISSDNVYSMESWLLYGASSCITDVYLKNLSGVDGFFGADATRLSNIVIDNDRVKSICDANGVRVLITSSDETKLIDVGLCCRAISNDNIQILGKKNNCWSSNSLLSSIHLGHSNFRNENNDTVLLNSNKTIVLKTANVSRKNIGNYIANTPSISSLSSYSFARCNHTGSSDDTRILSCPNIKHIGSHTFSYGNILSVIFPNLEYTDNSGFAALNSRYIDVGKIKEFKEQMFYYSSSYSGFPQIKADYVEIIGKQAFLNRTGILSYTFPEVLSVKENAFENCIALSSLYIPKCVYFAPNSFLKAESMRILSCGTTISQMKDMFSSTGLPNRCSCYCIDGCYFNGKPSSNLKKSESSYVNGILDQTLYTTGSINCELKFDDRVEKRWYGVDGDYSVMLIQYGEDENCFTFRIENNNDPLFIPRMQSIFESQWNMLYFDELDVRIRR